MKHQKEAFATFRAEDGKLYWVTPDGSWIHPVVRGGDGPNDGNDGNDGNDDDDNKPTITQKQLDEILKTRIGKARETAVKNLLKELGFDDPESFKTVLAAAKKAEDDNKSDLEKAKADLEKEKSTSKSAKDELEDFRLKTAIKDALIEKGLKPSQASVVVKLVEVTENDPDKIKEAIEALEKTMPQVFVAEGGKAPIQGGNPGTPPPNGGGDGNDPSAIAKQRLYARHPELAQKK